jgi:hypothetical protein
MVTALAVFWHTAPENVSTRELPEQGLISETSPNQAFGFGQIRERLREPPARHIFSLARAFFQAHQFNSGQFKAALLQALGRATHLMQIRPPIEDEEDRTYRPYTAWVC